MYYMLVSSLPPLPVHFESEGPPISRERLEQRLRLLVPEDAAQLAAAFQILRWGRQFEEADDAAVIKRCNVLMRQIYNPVLRQIMSRILGGREIVAGLRRRQRKLGPLPVSLGEWGGTIRRNFTRPDFGMGAIFPWITLVDQHLRDGAIRKIYELMLGALWRYLRELSDRNYFNFEAVVLYVARWDVVHRWNELKAEERGREVFERLMKEVLGDYANVHS